MALIFGSACSKLDSEMAGIVGHDWVCKNPKNFDSSYWFIHFNKDGSYETWFVDSNQVTTKKVSGTFRFNKNLNTIYAGNIVVSIINPNTLQSTDGTYTFVKQ